MQNVHSPLSRSALECPYLHGDNEFTEELQRLAKSDLNEDEETRARCLEELRSRLRDEPGLQWQDDELFLLAFLRARKFSVDRAVSLVKGYYGIVGKYPHLYYGVCRKDLNLTLAQNCLYVLPQRDDDGCTVAIFRHNTWDPELANVEFLHYAGITSLCHVLRHHSAQIAGLKLIFDLSGFTFKQLSYMRPWHVWLFGEMLQNCFPYRMRGLHWLNENRIFHSLWVVLRQFLSKKLTERVHFHGKNLEGLHQFINPRILPSEYGGEQPSFNNSGMREVMEASADYTEYVHSFGYEKHLKVLVDEKTKSHGETPEKEREAAVIKE